MKITFTRLSLCYALILAFLLNSCEKIEKPIRIRVNQFKQTVASASGPKLALSVQIESEVGGEDWNALEQQIIGFNYEPGYIYELLVTEAEVIYPSNSQGNQYLLKQVVSKTKVDESISFKVDLKIDNINCIKGNQQIGYNILGLVNVDCGNLCNEIEQAINSNSTKN